MDLYLLSIGVLACGAVFSLIFFRNRRLAGFSGVIGAIAGSVSGLVFSGHALLQDEPLSIKIPWSIPLAEFSFRVDRLSAFFLVLLFTVSFLSAIYASDYLKGYSAKKAIPGHWALFNLFIAAMSLVLAADNLFFFLTVWELMSLISFFLVSIHNPG